MKATWNDKVIAQADKTDLIFIEGGWYFPPSAVKKEYLKSSDTHTTCFWKEQASYYNIDVDGETNEDAAWYYPEPMEGSVEKVKNDFTNYVSFWQGVQIGE